MYKITIKPKYPDKCQWSEVNKTILSILFWPSPQMKLSAIAVRAMIDTPSIYDYPDIPRISTILQEIDKIIGIYPVHTVPKFITEYNGLTNQFIDVTDLDFYNINTHRYSWPVLEGGLFDIEEYMLKRSILPKPLMMRLEDLAKSNEDDDQIWLGILHEDTHHRKYSGAGHNGCFGWMVGCHHAAKALFISGTLTGAHEVGHAIGFEHSDEPYLDFGFDTITNKSIIESGIKQLMYHSGDVDRWISSDEYVAAYAHFQLRDNHIDLDTLGKLFVKEYDVNYHVAINDLMFGRWPYGTLDLNVYKKGFWHKHDANYY